MSRSSQFQKPNKKVIIFDFDGVLADSFDHFYSLNRDGMKHVGLSFTKEQYRNLFIGNVHQGFKNFINDDQKYLTFSEFRNENYDRNYYNKEGGVKLFPEALTFLKKIGEKYILTVASSSHKNNIKNLLEKNKVLDIFGLIIANTTTTKAGMLNEIMKKFNAKPSEVLMITDTIGDILIAKKSGLKTIAATWGFHSSKLLRSAKPDCLASNFKMLYKQLKAF
ncbi:MAG: hypothetical protein A2915_03135 [Candidatus Yanofskybacteria bacterium RIFCSPLOWO2_01_FULL_41_34]|uniref:FCP1 homology domain-containing protein n=1 Tax=Candidatus Yanofskybacteria bacterium RIFCSPHIGHO2_01_FULL_41_26 TaxID=1802661 RepID=A0A1F8EDK1_9BACT|nr:MAG: hypothetical protein A2649_01030 [Candidatus Yanofskybacteria bacterium RIFCSPHIGHO2_01_FULL_41_26]OGN21029.1 MAG: hypothetical protein A2915_03135 [Candidatus Yanofskybacteria bacterium RIFCSPLOWO2_01_FULL_41_34]